MTELNYNELTSEIIQKIETIRQITLATCVNEQVFARTVCPINDGLTIYFGTNGKSDKAQQIGNNTNIAFAIDNIQIEAIAENLGHPDNHPKYCEKYTKKYPQFGSIYPAKPDDIVVIAKPTKITLYKYLNKPCEDVLDIQNSKAYRIDF